MGTTWRVRLAGERIDDRLAEKAPRPAWLKFVDQFKSLLVIILLGAAVLAGAIGDLKDAIVIVIVVSGTASSAPPIKPSIALDSCANPRCETSTVNTTPATNVSAMLPVPTA